MRILPERDGPGVQALAVEIDPRRHTVTLVWRTLGLGDAEVGSRALYRGFIEEPGEPDAALPWLEGPEAQALLARVAEGYGCSTTWSGDPVGTWTEEAWGAAERVVERVRGVMG